MANLDFPKNDDGRHPDGPDLRALREESARSLAGRRDTPIVCVDCGAGLPLHKRWCEVGVTP